MKNYQELIDRYYPEGTLGREIYMRHARQVTDKALSVAKAHNIGIPAEEITAAAMLHDIGICLTDAPSIGCNGKQPYIAHGTLGAELLRKEGFPEEIARVAERHTGAGLTVEDIDNQNLPLPRKDYCPETELERLVCYADKFFSKSGDMKEKSAEAVRRSMGGHSAAALARWTELEKEFA